MESRDMENQNSEVIPLTKHDTNNDAQQLVIGDDQKIAVAKRKIHPRPKRSENYTPHAEPGEMSAMISQALHISSFGPVDTNDPEQVEQRISEYFTYCIQHDIRPSAEGVALSLNTTRTTLWRWREGQESNKPDGVRNAIKKSYSILNYLLAQYMQDGHINPVSGIFLLKNNYQYYDKSEVVITPNNPYPQAEVADVNNLVETLPDPEKTEEE